MLDGGASLMWSVKSVVTQQTEEETLAGSPAACSYTLPSQTMTSSLFSELPVCSRRAREQYALVQNGLLKNRKTF